MKLSQIYTDFFVHWFTNGSLMGNNKISSVGIKPNIGRVDTKGKIRKMIVITKLPNECQINLNELVKIGLHNKYPRVKTFVTQHCIPKKVSINSDVFRRKMEHSNEHYKEEQEIMRQLSDTDKELGKTVRVGGKSFKFNKSKLNKLKYTAESYKYTYRYQSSGGQFMRVMYSIEYIADNMTELNNYREDLMNILRSKRINFREINNNTSSFLENFGVAGLVENTALVPTMLFSDENLASNSHSRTMGLVGGKGILMGVDRMTGLPLMLDLFSSGAAQIILVYGRTGSGKTYLCFQTALSLIAEGVHCSAIDIKGNEWSLLSKFVDVTEIQMGNENARFVNTLRLDDIKADYTNSNMFYNNAVQGTVQLLSIMVNLQPNEGNARDLQDILEQSVKKLLSSYEVYPDKPDSFKNTANIKLQEILRILNGLTTSDSYKKTDKGKLVHLIVSRCYSFLETDSGTNTMFKNEITMGEILNSPMVIYSFNKNDNSTPLDINDSLRVFMVQFLDTKKQSLRKQQGLQNACFYEELQRCAQFSSLVTYIKHAVTGSRSNNVKMFMLVNDLSSLEEGALRAVQSSITTKIIGVTNETDQRRLVNDYGCKDILPMIQKVSKDDAYARCFVIDFDTGDAHVRNDAKDKTIFRVVLPKSISNALDTVTRIE